MSSAIGFNLDQSENLSSGNGLKENLKVTMNWSSANGFSLDMSKILLFGKGLKSALMLTLYHK